MKKHLFVCNDTSDETDFLHRLAVLGVSVGEQAGLDERVLLLHCHGKIISLKG